MPPGTVTTVQELFAPLSLPGSLRVEAGSGTCRCIPGSANVGSVRFPIGGRPLTAPVRNAAMVPRPSVTTMTAVAIDAMTSRKSGSMGFLPATGLEGSWFCGHAAPRVSDDQRKRGAPYVIRHSYQQTNRVGRS